MPFLIVHMASTRSNVRLSYCHVFFESFFWETYTPQNDVDGAIDDMVFKNSDTI